MLAAAALVLVAGAAYALWPRKTGPQSAIAVEPNPIDFGSVSWLEAPVKTITLRNRSSRDVVLRPPRFNCSCFGIVRAMTTSHLRPGQSTSLDVALQSQKGTPGRFHKTFTLDSDDPMYPTLEVPVVGAIVDFRQVSPREVFFGDVTADSDPVEKTVEIRGGAGFRVEVKDVVSVDPRFEASTKPVVDGADLLVRTKKGFGGAKGPVDAQIKMTLEVTSEENKTPRRYPESIWARAVVK